MERKILKYIISIIIFIIILIIALIIKLNKNNNSDISPEVQEYFDKKIENDNINIINENLVEINSEFTEVSDVNTYYTIKKIVEDYIETLSKLNMTEEDVKQEFITSRSITEEMIQEYVKDEILFNANKIKYYFNEDYIKNIDFSNIENIKKIFGNYYKEYIDIENMYELNINSNICSYLIKGNIINKNTLEKKELFLLILTDKNNNTFKIYNKQYLNELGYEKLDYNSKVNIKINNIENEKYNIYKIINYNNEEYAKEILNTYKQKLQYDMQNSYELLDNNYKELRFENKEEYNKYINENKLKILNIKIIKFQKIKTKNYTQIVIMDENNDYYIFNIKKPGKFKVFLDNYTVLSYNQKDSYNQAFDNTKCSMNIERFINAINEKNYYFAYNLLTPSFKSSNFITKEEFINYIENKWLNNISAEVLETNISKSGNYICKTKISNGEEEKNIYFYITLKKDLEFTISFELN